LTKNAEKKGKKKDGKGRKWAVFNPNMMEITAAMDCMGFFESIGEKKMSKKGVF
jgi:hypothetical protein